MTPSSPSAKDMGPIERELRKASRWKTPFGAAQVLREEPWDVCMSAARSLGILGASEIWTHWADIMSEAIEFASENGL